MGRPATWKTSGVSSRRIASRRAMRACTIGRLGYEMDDYRRLMAVVAEVAPGGRIVSALDGGYNLGALGACVVAHLGPMLP
jgi:acetoin utilization deacetylase AcuC-like enzyme